MAPSPGVKVRTPSESMAGGSANLSADGAMISNETCWLLSFAGPGETSVAHWIETGPSPTWVSISAGPGVKVGGSLTGATQIR